MENVNENKKKSGLKMLKVTCSGSFKTSPSTDRNRHDFSNVDVLIPKIIVDVKNPELFLEQHVQRMFPIAKNKNKSLEGKAFNGLIKVYIDGVEDVDGEPDCIGSTIKTMTWEQIQSFACMMNFREIPLYRHGAIRTAQEKAYELWQSRILKKRVFRTPNDIKIFKETMRRNLEALMLTDDEIEDRIKSEVEKGFSMIVNPQNPSESYSFSKVDDIQVPPYNPITLKETKK